MYLLDFIGRFYHAGGARGCETVHQLGLWEQLCQSQIFAGADIVLLQQQSCRRADSVLAKQIRNLLRLSNGDDLQAGKL